jgi:hypothetical protein
MHRLFACILLASMAAYGQTIVNPDKMAAALKRILGQQSGGSSVKCEVTPIKPVLNWGFRFQAGYVARVPLSQYFGAGHKWAVIVRITPEQGERRPVYLMTRVELPNIPETKLHAETGGGYLLGEGRYEVEWTLVDETHRTCRKEWTIKVERRRSERKVQVAMPPHTVRGLSLRDAIEVKREKTDVGSLRVTVLLHATPLSPRRTKLRPADTLMLLGSLSSLLERLPSQSVRLVVFNLDQQKEIFRKNGFDPAALDEVARSMNKLELGSVDYSVLQNRRGHLQLLSDLVNEELAAKDPSDVVVFLGPASRHWDRVVQGDLEKPRDAPPHFFYFQLKPYFRLAPAMPDIIQRTVDNLKGKTANIHTPGEFAKAIEQLESRPSAGK